VSTNEVISAGRRRRRSHGELFKAEAIGACQQEATLQRLNCAHLTGASGVLSSNSTNR
jgi:hypothetical protein